MGGEEINIVGPLGTWKGLPPRGRGRAACYRGVYALNGITPAWAGKRMGLLPIFETLEDYPRVGGEERLGVEGIADGQGLPPRGRGRDYLFFGSILAFRITPAWAGKRYLNIEENASNRDYPRVGGEELTAKMDRNTILGLPPRGRGRVATALTCLAA